MVLKQKSIETTGLLEKFREKLLGFLGIVGVYHIWEAVKNRHPLAGLLRQVCRLCDRPGTGDDAEFIFGLKAVRLTFRMKRQDKA